MSAIGTTSSIAGEFNITAAVHAPYGRRASLLDTGAFDSAYSNAWGLKWRNAAKTADITAITVDANNNTSMPNGLTCGIFGTPVSVSTANANAIGVFLTSTATTGRINAVQVESYVAPAAKTTSGGLYAGRFVSGVAASSTLAPTTSVYLAGLQGKLDPAGAVGDGTGSGQIYACGVLAQINNGAGSFGSECQEYGLWVDNQFVGAGAAVSHLVNVTNNGGSIRDFFHLYGNLNVSRFLTVENAGAAIVTGSTAWGANANGYLVFNIDGVARKVPFI